MGVDGQTRRQEDEQDCGGGCGNPYASTGTQHISTADVTTKVSVQLFSFPRQLPFASDDGTCAAVESYGKVILSDEVCPNSMQYSAHSPM